MPNSLKYSISVIFGLTCFISAERGDLIEYNLQASMNLTEIQFILGLLGMADNIPTYGISVFDIAYETEESDGTLDTLSGLVCIPVSNTLAFPIATYHHGTIILDEEAPSNNGFSMDNLEIILIGLIMTPSGFIVIFPDYEGIGDPDEYHPYIVAEPYVSSVVDMIRSVKHLSQIIENEYRFQFNDQLFLFGYSEGGYATMAVQKGIETDYADEFNVTASFPMAGPYDLGGTMVDYFLSIPSYPVPYYVPYVLTSHLWYYDENPDFTAYFEPFWADTLPSLFDGTHSGSEIDNLMPSNPLDILLPEVLEEFEDNEEHFFRIHLNENTLLDWVPQNPTYLFHGMGDDIIPYENAQVAYDTFIANGASEDMVNLTLYPEAMGGHAELAIPCILGSYNVILAYQALSPKGDMNSDGQLTIEDSGLLVDSILEENELTEFQWWAGDADTDDSHSVLDLLLVLDQIDN